VIALGANLGDRLATLREAVRRIDALAPVRATSRVYETAPVGGPAQPDYLNAAILVEWEGTPIELALGRVRSVPNAPRTLDLDILWIEGTELETDRLTVPHPRLLSRAFALRPLLDVVPDAYPIPPGMIQDPGCRETSETLM
jgi:2-amino-4-hydroxy-6-hydroxymethyldihydropteridine diphosphokinase